MTLYKFTDYLTELLVGRFLDASSILIGIHASGDIFTYLRLQAKMTERFLRYY